MLSWLGSGVTASARFCDGIWQPGWAVSRLRTRRTWDWVGELAYSAEAVVGYEDGWETSHPPVVRL